MVINLLQEAGKIIEEKDKEILQLKLRLSKLSVALEYYDRTKDDVFLEISQMYVKD